MQIEPGSAAVRYTIMRRPDPVPGLKRPSAEVRLRSEGMLNGSPRMVWNASRLWREHIASPLPSLVQGVPVLPFQDPAGLASNQNRVFGPLMR